MLNAGFQYLEQRDANDKITKDGVVGKNSPFATSDNSGIYDVIAEDLRWLKENVDDVKDTSDLEAIKQSVTDMYNDMKNDSSFGEATAKAQAEEAKKQAQVALESATNAKTYYDDITTKSTEVNDTIAEIKSYIEKAEALVESNKTLEQSISDSATVATNKAKSAANSATNAATSETNAKASETKAKTSETNAKVSETNAAKSESNAKSHMDATALSETHAKTSETNAKASQTASKTSETNAKASETNAKQYSINSSNSADLAKAWAESSDSPDSVNDKDSTTGKTQSSKTWAIYSKDRAISAFTSETYAKTSETNAKASETNAANSATNSASSATASANSAKASATSATNAKTSETNAATSASNAKVSETNAKTSETNSANSAQSSSDSSDLSKAWSVSTTSPDNIADKDSPTSKTQSSRTWALYSRDRAISAFKSETNAKASETASKTSETNAADSASRAKASETSASTSAVNAATSASNAKTSETNAKASETNASASKTDAATSETNAKSYMATAKEYMQKAQEALAAAQAIQSLIDTSKANAEKCLADVEAVKESLAKMITYQGSVDNYSDLPTNPQVGYSYNVKNADKTHGVNAGDNLIWNGTDWDNFGSYVDMSLFAELGKDVKFNSVTAKLIGNAATATKLATARTIALSGNATGSTTFDGSGNATINTTVSESAHAATATQVIATAPNGGGLDVIHAIMGDNDAARVRVYGDANNGALEIATGDDGTEPIYARQYKNSSIDKFTTVARTAAILDGNGNTSFPGTVTAASFTGPLNGNAATATNSAAANALNIDTYRPADANVQHGDGKIRYFLATSAMSKNKPPTGDGQIIDLAWDTNFGWDCQLFVNNTTGRLNMRGQSAGKWSEWLIGLDSGNFNNYAPTKTGGGASGTWNINISGTATNATKATTAATCTGNSATASKLATARSIALTGNATGSAEFDGSGNISISTNVNTATNADKVDGYHESSFLRYRGDAAANGEDTYWSQIGIKRYEGKLPQGISGTYDYGGVVSLPAGAGARLDIWYNHTCSTNGDGLWYRSGYDTDKQAWARLLDTVNYTKYAPTKTGGGASGTWPISISGNAAKATTAATCTGNSATATKATTALNIPTSDVGGNIWIS